MSFGACELEDIVAVGCISDRSARVWARTKEDGRCRLVLRPRGADPLATFDLELHCGPTDCTGAWTIPDDLGGGARLQPDTAYEVDLRRGDRRLATASFRTAPASRESAPKRWSFAAFSCHQPFASDGSILSEAQSMLKAAHAAFTEADVRFVLMMGDQAYADHPPSASLFDPEYFVNVAPPGRASILECTPAEVRAIYQQRHRIFWACEPFQALQRSFACYPMLDDHEVVDNFGTHPDHATPAWAALREGALSAFFDYQASRVHRAPDGRRPSSFDWGFVWGPAAVWGMDIRSNRRTVDDITQVYSEDQLASLRRFLVEHRELPLVVLMTPIPIVHVEGKLANAAGRLLPKGSDVHERWSHAQCVDDRNRLLHLMLEHSRANPHQNLLFLGGDVHSGAAFQINFDNGVQAHQLTSSAISNHENALAGKVMTNIARTVSRIHLSDGTIGDVGLIRGIDRSVDHNPLGDLNAGIIDVIDHGDRVGLRLRLISHDGHGGPITRFDSGELGRRVDPSRRVVGLP